ncbi:MAG: discoidin domain-containing protein [Candidatus Sulfotelmatobacter sp.]
MKTTARLFACLSACVIFTVSAAAQTIQVDITPAHSTNHFRPNETLGAGVDRIPSEAVDSGLTEPNLGLAMEAGWQPVSYRNNTELSIEAWHWNSQGTWSEPGEKGYFTGSTVLGEPIRHSYGYSLPHRGFTRNDGTPNAGYSRITDGDDRTYWKSNPYLTQHFTGESDSLHPQWVVLDLAQMQQVDSIRIKWAEPYATRFLVQHWIGEDPMHSPTRGVWQTYSNGAIEHGHGGSDVLRLQARPLLVRFVRILMTESSNTCAAGHISTDPRACAGYAISEIYLGSTSADGEFHDILRHTQDQEQTTTYCSSVDPWHDATDLGTTHQAQAGFDLFFTSGVTRGLPAMIPIALVYDTPENAVAEIAYLEKRKYPISYIEMGEEMEGQYLGPEDYGALYIQWATALHHLDPTLKLGGPSLGGLTEDLESWPAPNGKTSWVARFIDYLKQHGHIQDLSFFSFEHYPYDGCRIPWGSLYDETELVSHVLQIWRDDGVPRETPMFITEGNLSSAASETYMDIFSGLWLADYVGSFLAAGGKGIYYFHYLPLQMEHGCNDSPGTYGMFSVDAQYNIQQPLAQFFVSQLINLEWVASGSQPHDVYPAKGDVDDGAGHALVTAYALKRPDGQWSLLVVNRDQQNAHRVRIEFEDHSSQQTNSFIGSVELSTFGKAQYQWHPGHTRYVGHAEYPGEPSVVAESFGHADPDGPILHTEQNATADTTYELPAASVVVIRGNIRGR